MFQINNNTAVKGQDQAYIRGAFGNALQCVDKMLSNNTFLETRIQPLLDGLIFVEKGLGVQLQRMLRMSRVHTLAEFLCKIFLKNEGKFGTLFTIMV